MPFPIASLIPIAAGIGQNILQGINNRKARLYNSPANQVARLREAGLPLAAGSNITGGQQTPTQAVSFGTESFNDNIGKGITRDIDRQKLKIAKEELISAQSAAAIAAGFAKNQLNPSGQFEPTNQGVSVQQSIQAQEQAIKGAKIVNEWLPTEKAQAILKNNKEIQKISADTANSLAQNNILVAEGKIKNILANWQENMSSAEYSNLIARTTGIRNQNEISAIQGEILRQTKIAQIHTAQMAAVSAGQNVAANQLGLLVRGLETESAKAYYKVRARVDESYTGKLFGDVLNPRDIIYLQMFTPKESALNIGSMLGTFK